MMTLFPVPQMKKELSHILKTDEAVVATLDCSLQVAKDFGAFTKESHSFAENVTYRSSTKLCQNCLTGVLVADILCYTLTTTATFYSQVAFQQKCHTHTLFRGDSLKTVLTINKQCVEVR